MHKSTRRSRQSKFSQIVYNTFKKWKVILSDSAEDGYRCMYISDQDDHADHIASKLWTW
jgi:hypothetical protein